MPDDLRTRIAAAIHAGLKDQEDVESRCGTLEKHADGGAWTAITGVYDLSDLADAVIRELRPERRCEYCGRTGTQKFTKTGTGWVCRSVYACNRRCRRA